MGRGNASGLIYGSGDASRIHHRPAPPSVRRVRRGHSNEWRLISSDKIHLTDGPAVKVAAGDTYPWASLLDQSLRGLGKRQTDLLPAPSISGRAELWARQGKLHRSDGPALIREGELEIWFIEGKPGNPDPDHPTVIVGAEGRPYYVDEIAVKGPARIWGKDGQVHREGAPAIEADNGLMVWVQEGVTGRPPKEGPAIVLPEGISWESKSGKFVDGPAEVYISKGRFIRAELLGEPARKPCPPESEIWRSWRRGYRYSGRNINGEVSQPEAHLWVFEERLDFAPGVGTAKAACGSKGLNYDGANRLYHSDAPHCSHCETWLEEHEKKSSSK